MTSFIRRNWLLIAIVVAGAVARFATLGEQSFWLDEEATLNVIGGGGIGDVIDGVRHGESNPPLYYLLADLWTSVFGDGEAGIRSLSAVLGTATIPLMYGAAEALASRRAGLIAAALTAASPILVWYSQESRNYALLVFFAAVAFLCFARALRGDGRGWLWGWALASALALCTHYFALAVIAPQAIWLVARWAGRRVEPVLATGAVALAGAALLPLLSTQRGRGGWIDEFDLGDRLAQVPEHFLVGFQVPWPAIPLVAVAILVCVCVYGAVSSPDRARFAIPWSILFAGVLILLVSAATGDDYIVTRNLLALWVPFAIGVAVSLGAASLERLGVATAALLCALGIGLIAWTAATPAAQRPDYATLAASIGPAGNERLIVSQTGFSSPLSIYLDAHPARDDELVTSELVVVDPKPTEDYGIGPCWWLSTCGGVDLLPVPRFEPPPGFEVERTGETELFTYTVLEARKPTPIERPTEFLTPRVFVQPPA